MFKWLFFHILCVTTFFSCSENTDSEAINQGQRPYDIDHPTNIYTLPKTLKEISGICTIGDNKIACINDENGTIYIYQTDKEKIIDKINFSDKGDFEDIAVVDSEYYILRSDGAIIKHSYGNSETFSTPLKQPCDTEALCYDSASNRLLITCKEGASEIWEFNLDTKKFNPNPVLKIPAINFRTTAMAINKADNNYLYLLSPNAIIAIDSTSKLIGSKELRENIFPQPEGITFNSKGDLFISNEGKDKSATIIEFKRED